MCHPENNPGWTNGGLKELVERETAENILILFNLWTFAMFVKPTTKSKRLTGAENWWKESYSLDKSCATEHSNGLHLLFFHRTNKLPLPPLPSLQDFPKGKDPWVVQLRK